MSIRRFFRRSSEDSDLRQEIQSHIAHEIDENIARGVPESEARRQAHLKFGSRQRVREAVWEWNTLEFLESGLRDLRYAARSLSRAPSFTLIAILVMALGIGATTSLFSVVRSILLEPLPFKDPDRLVMLYEQSLDSKYPYNVVAPGIFGEWQKQVEAFQQMALWRENVYNLSGAGGQLPESIRATICSWNLFSTLGVQPLYGRLFDSADDTPAANGTVILSWGLWKRRYGGDRSIVGKEVLLDSRSYTVIGVMPSWFSYPSLHIQAWTPAYHENTAADMQAPDSHSFRVVARLRPGASMTQGLSQLDLIEHRVHDAHLNQDIGTAANIRPLLEEIVGNYRTPLYALFAATACVLLIACLNVANLLVARSSAKRRELAIRSALGGSRWRLLREHLTESLVLSFASGAIALPLAYFIVQWVIRTRQDMARVDAIQVNGLVLAFAIIITALTGVFVGLISASSVAQRHIVPVLQESSRSQSGSRSKSRLRKALLAIEVSLTVMLLIAAGLLLKSYEKLRSADLGCETRNILTMRVTLPDARYKSPAQHTAFFEQLITRVRNLPGVQAAGLVSQVPGAGYWMDSLFTVIEHPPLPKGDFQYAAARLADPGYFAAIGIPLLRGRTFTDAERLDRATAAIISDSFALTYFPGEDPIGKHLRLNEEINYEIVGIVGDTRYLIARPSAPMMYFPLYKGSFGDSAIVVRSHQDVASLALPVQKIIAQLDPDLAISDVLTMEQVIGQGTQDASFNASLVLAFAVLSLLVACAGLYGVLSYLVMQRTAEIGIRMALGAQRGSVLGLMFMDGLGPVCIGLMLGLMCGGLAARAISNILYGTQPLDWSIFVSAALALSLVACAACALPAWRASRLDAMQALRS